MKLEVKYPEKFSRGELILRTFFGWIYILIPHLIILYFLSIGLIFIRFIATFAILFTGEYPKGMFNFTVGMLKWSSRLHTRIYNLSDGYPAFGINAEDPFMKLTIEYPTEVSRGLTLIRFLFGGFYVGIPHLFILIFRMLANNIITIIAFWIVLFTGKYPKSMFDFSVGTLRWVLRISAYLYYLTDDYPPFTGKEIEKDSPEIL